MSGRDSRETAPAKADGRVAAAMSGGVDSSVAAALLVDQGHEVVGFTARMWKEGSRCCSVEDVQRARDVCRFLDIHHMVINALDVFSRCVVDRFAAEYVRGRTPSPCVVCNQLVKFGLLLTRAVQYGCSHLATGHYARVVERDGVRRLFKAHDRSRDQSYFLHRLSQRQLAHTLFPLGELSKKDDVTPYTESRGLPLTRREESQDICFAPAGRHHEVVEKFFPKLPGEGPLVDTAGKRLGTHEGIHRYTVGQRRGLGVAARHPLYVTRIDPQTNTVEVGSREETETDMLLVEDVRWVAGDAPDPLPACNVRIRYKHTEAPATLGVSTDGRIRVLFGKPQFGVAPGQAAVFYDGDEVLGGGWISRA